MPLQPDRRRPHAASGGAGGVCDAGDVCVSHTNAVDSRSGSPASVTRLWTSVDQLATRACSTAVAPSSHSGSSRPASRCTPSTSAARAQTSSRRAALLPKIALAASTGRLPRARPPPAEPRPFPAEAVVAACACTTRPGASLATIMAPGGVAPRAIVAARTGARGATTIVDACGKSFRSTGGPVIEGERVAGGG